MPEAAGNRPWLMIWQVFCKSSTNTLLTFLQCKSRLTPRRSWSTRRTFYEVLAQLRANIPRGNLFKNKDELTLISYIRSLNSNQKLYVLTTQQAWRTLVWLTPASGRCLQQRRAAWGTTPLRGVCHEKASAFFLDLQPPTSCPDFRHHSQNRCCLLTTLRRRWHLISLKLITQSFSACISLWLCSVWCWSVHEET